MNFIKYLLNIFKKKPIQTFGIIDSDIKSGAKYERIYEQKEVVASIAIPTFNGIANNGTIRKFPYQYQASSKSCVARTMAKIATILFNLLNGRIVKWSAGFWYRQRSNYPEGGMFFEDAVKLSALGCITEEILPSENMSEDEINALDIKDYLKETADGFAMPIEWVEVPLDFDTVASTIEQTKKGIMLWFNFGAGEFFYTNYPKSNGGTDWNHSVCAVDTCIKNGTQYIVIEDSADSINYYQKYISREFFKEKCILARYPLNFKFEIKDNKPKFDGSVKSLQDILKYEGMFPSNVPSTGFFGTITKNALILFQKKYGISPSLGNFGPITKAYLENNYK